MQVDFTELTLEFYAPGQQESFPFLQICRQNFDVDLVKPIL